MSVENKEAPGCWPNLSLTDPLLLHSKVKGENGTIFINREQ